MNTTHQKKTEKETMKGLVQIMNPTQNPSALRSKNLITQTLLNLLRQYTFSEITVKQILLEAKLSRKTFYRNFRSKEDVLDSYIASILVDYKEAVLRLETVSFQDTFDIIFDFCEANRELLMTLRDNELLHIPLMQLNTLLPSLHNDTDEKIYIIYFNIGGIWNIIINWIENDMVDSPDKIKEALIYYLNHIGNIDLCENLKK